MTKVSISNPSDIGCQVQLDGVPVKDCIEADDLENYVLFHERGITGKLIVKVGVAVVKKLFGKVTIHRPKG